MIQLIAILCLAVYGALISLLVGLKHDIAERLRVDDSKAGILFSGFMFAGAVGVIVLSASIDLLGHALVSRCGFGFTAAALLLPAFCRRYGQYLSVYVLQSVGAMCIISVGNTLLPLVLFGGGNAAAATNLGNGFYGVGAFFVSFFLTGSLQHFGYRATVLFFAGLLLGAAVLASLAEYPVIDSHFNFGDLPAVLTSSFFL
ncbi:MFS transporter, partial [Alistipes onderdonkii]